MDEQKNNGETSDKRLLDLLTELAEVQKEIAMLNAKIFVREGTEQVKGKVAEISNAIQEQAKMYGKKAQDLAQQYSENSEQKGNILQEYEQALFEVNAEYAKRMKTIMTEKQALQAEEQQTYGDERLLRAENRRIKRSPEYLQHMQQEKKLSSEIKKALDKGDLKAVTQKTEELKELKAKNPLTKNEAKIGEVQARREEIAQLLEECEQNLKACKNERYDKIEEITSDKNNQLAVIPKQNIVQRIFGKLFNKLNGLSKFKDNVIANITGKIETIKTEQLPAIKKTVQEKGEQFLEEMQNKKAQIRLKARGAKDAVGQGIQDIRTTVRNRASQTFTSIINSGKQAKDSIKARLQQSLEQAKATQEERQSKLFENSDKTQNPIEVDTGR